MIDLPTYKTKDRVKCEPPAEVDIAVVGAGLGGLTASAFLARQGWRVACFDSHYVAGGCATQFSRGSGDQCYVFDVGLHYIGDCAPGGKIPTLLRSLGIEQDFVPLDPDGFDELVFPDFKFRVPANLELFRERLLHLFPEEKNGIDRYVRFLQQINDVMLLTDRTEGKITPKAAWYILSRGWQVLRYQKSSLHQVLEHCTKHPMLRAVLAAQHGDYALPPSQISAIMHAGLVNHYFRGAYYPKGGGQILSNRIADVVEKHGGSIHLRREVTGIVIEQGRAVGIRIRSHHGEEHTIRAKIVLSGADIIQTFKRLVGPEHLPKTWQKKLNAWKMAHALFVLFLGVKGDLQQHGMRGVNYWKYDSYDTEHIYRNIEQNPSILPMSSYTTSGSLKDPHSAHAPTGHQTLEIMTVMNGANSRWHVEPHEIANWSYRRKEPYIDLKHQIEEKLLEHLEQQFPGIRNTIVFRESATPISHGRYTQATGGTSYGLASTPDQYLGNRPGHKSPLHGLYLCGVSTRSGHGIIGAMNSGHESACEIARFLGRPIPAIHE